MQLTSLGIIFDTIPNASIFAVSLTSRLAESWAWYVCRGSGILAAILLFVLIASGIGLLTGFTYRIFEPLKAWSVHRALGIALAVSIIIHVVVLLFDTYTTFSIVDLLVPFASKFSPVTILGIQLGSFYLALGIIALYITLAIVLTSIFWIQKKSHFWHLIHFLSYLVMIFVFVHALFIGTDMKNVIGKVLWWTGAAILFFLVIKRISRAGTTKS